MCRLPTRPLGRRYALLTASSVAKSTCEGERNNTRDVGYVQQLMRTDKKWTAARSATCQLISDTCLVAVYQHNIHTCYCYTSTTVSHTKGEKIYCCITRSILYNSRGDWLSIISLGRRYKVLCSVSHTQKSGKILGVLVLSRARK